MHSHDFREMIRTSALLTSHATMKILKQALVIVSGLRKADEKV